MCPARGQRQGLHLGDPSGGVNWGLEFEAEGLQFWIWILGVWILGLGDTGSMGRTFGAILGSSQFEQGVQGPDLCWGPLWKAPSIHRSFHHSHSALLGHICHLFSGWVSPYCLSVYL